MNFLGLLLLLPGLALAQYWPAQADHLRHGLPGRLRRRRGGAHAAGPAREVARPAAGDRLQAGRRRQRRLGGRGQGGPDGYTFLLGTAATHGVNAALYSKLPFDVEADFTPISTARRRLQRADDQSRVIDAKTVQDFIAKVKAAPGKYNYASTGNGTGTHLAFAEFVHKAGLDMVHVPYKGGPEALATVVTGEMCCILNQVQTVLAQWSAGKVRAARRHDRQARGRRPDVPTIDEAGLPGYESYIWFGSSAPRDSTRPSRRRSTPR